MDIVWRKLMLVTIGTLRGKLINKDEYVGAV